MITPFRVLIPVRIHVCLIQRTECDAHCEAKQVAFGSVGMAYCSVYKGLILVHKELTVAYK